MMGKKPIETQSRMSQGSMSRYRQFMENGIHDIDAIEG